MLGTVRFANMPSTYLCNLADISISDSELEGADCLLGSNMRPVEEYVFQVMGGKFSVKFI